MKVMIYLDANIFIYAATNQGFKGEKCRKILFDLSKNRFEGYTSVLTWDEVVHSILKKEGKDKAIDQGKDFLKLPNLTFLDSTLLIISNAQQLCEEKFLKPRDAIHAATAINHKIKKIASDDSDFDKVKELKRIRI